MLMFVLGMFTSVAVIVLAAAFALATGHGG